MCGYVCTSTLISILARGIGYNNIIWKANSPGVFTWSQLYGKLDQQAVK